MECGHTFSKNSRSLPKEKSWKIFALYVRSLSIQTTRLVLCLLFVALQGCIIWIVFQNLFQSWRRRNEANQMCSRITERKMLYLPEVDDSALWQVDLRILLFSWLRWNMLWKDEKCCINAQMISVFYSRTKMECMSVVIAKWFFLHFTHLNILQTRNIKKTRRWSLITICLTIYIANKSDIIKARQCFLPLSQWV